MFTACTVIASVQLLFLNICMKYYDHLDVVPIFMTSMLIFNISCGMVIFDEVENYDRNEFVGISAGIILCALGISIIVAKNTEIVKKEILSSETEKSNESREGEKDR